MTVFSVQRLLSRWAAGGNAYGAWCGIPSSLTVELLAGAGYDYVCIDLQHGIVGFSDLLPMLQAVEARGAAPLVRVPENEPAIISKVLDAGAAGVVVPLVNTADEAARAVAACRFPPVGTRSWGPLRASLVASSNDREVLNQVACLCMIETEEGLRNVEEIARTPGLTGLYIGPSDLALALGLPPGPEQGDERHVAAVEVVRRACAEAGVVAGMHTLRGAVARRHRERGFRMLTVVLDAALLRVGGAEHLAAAREGDEGCRGEGR